jgi:hypothetical protein
VKSERDGVRQRQRQTETERRKGETFEGFDSF